MCLTVAMDVIKNTMTKIDLGTTRFISLVVVFCGPRPPPTV